MQPEESERPSSTGPGGGRRPLVIQPDNSRMLRDIKNSLSHVHLQTQRESAISGRRGSIGLGLLPARPELSKSTPNIFDGNLSSTTGIGTESSQIGSKSNNVSNFRRNPYRKEELQKIAKSLAEFHKHDKDPLSDTEVMGREGLMQLSIQLQQVASQEGNSSKIQVQNGLTKPIISGRHSTFLNQKGHVTKAQDMKSNSSVDIQSELCSIRPESPNIRISDTNISNHTSKYNTFTADMVQNSPVSRMSNSDRQTPPPLPPRARPLVGNNIQNTRPPTPPPPPIPPQTYKGQIPPSSQYNTTAQRVVHPSQHQGQFINHNHVDHMFQIQQQQSQGYPHDNLRPVNINSQQNSTHNGPVTSAHGFGGGLNPSAHQMAQGSTNNSQVGMGGHYQQYVNPSQTGYSTRNTVQSQQQIHNQIVYPHHPGINVVVDNGSIGRGYNNNQGPYLVNGPDQMVLGGQAFSDTSPLSSNSPSPAPTPNPIAQFAQRQLQTQSRTGQGSSLQPVPIAAWGAKQPAILTHQVKKKKVPTATLR